MSEGKVPHIVFVGKTALDIYVHGTDWLGSISGNAANAALAATLGKHEDKPVDISVITTLGSAVNDKVHNSIRDRFQQLGIQVLSPEQSKVFLHFYQPGVSDRREENISSIREGKKLDFDAAQIPAANDLKPDVVVIGGALATNPLTSQSILTLQQDFRKKGAFVILDLPRRIQDASHIDELVSGAHVVKLSLSTLRSLWGDLKDHTKDFAGIGKVLDLGVRDVMVTNEATLNTEAYRRQFVETHIPSLKKVEKDRDGEKYFINEPSMTYGVAKTTKRHVFRPIGQYEAASVMAEEFLTGGLALAIAEKIREFGTTPRSFVKAMARPENISDTGARAQEVQVKALDMLEKPVEQQPDMLQPVIRTPWNGHAVRPLISVL